MDIQNIISRTREYVRDELSGEGTGHDWWHVDRVTRTALYIAGKEPGVIDLFVVELAALLHDIGDFKFHGGDETVGPRMAREWLEKTGVKEPEVSHVCAIVKDISFKGAGHALSGSLMTTLEGKVVQDADRLDALGAVGIARTFAYGGSKGREIYNPNIKPEEHKNFDEYKNKTGPTINHFYEKLLLLKQLMNTETGKELAEKRHQFMEDFLKEFFQEWNFS